MLMITDGRGALCRSPRREALLPYCLLPWVPMRRRGPWGIMRQVMHFLRERHAMHSRVSAACQDSRHGLGAFSRHGDP